MKSKLPFTSVVSYHTNPMTCGVAKFGKQLADRLGVPFVPLPEVKQYGSFPLLSLKNSELGYYEDVVAPECAQYGVFWHDGGRVHVTNGASVVFYADPSLGSPGLWCPSLLTPRKRPVRLFSFGMAHKLQTEKYRRVRELLDAAEQPYHLRVSVGLHEGTSLDGAEEHFDALKEIMGPDSVTILGILSDDAVSEELADAEYVLAFFKNGARANNTTVHAALQHGKTVITNFDGHQPSGWSYSMLNIYGLEAWPQCAVYAATEYDCGGAPPPSYYSWDNLISSMERICAASQSTATR